ncbi:response regulator transcription factor [Kribbella kalugense]|uniref:DNA-binding NarL/FixJ family response regulator n=1 Tax=Kribbella kalugense TaxID=2512221 RepID=A0A4R7ZYV2_9ACTN|nr:response regulator transcription factor [Kribbella kalugense]TDW23387.1 DNA-binding NarL/FixJ family response regulator [Kribbella kalugense]
MRVVIAEDSLLFREGMARLLTEAGFEVVAQAGDADELRILVERHRPDVAIVDIRMPPGYGKEGLTAAQEIRSRYPGTAVLVLSQYVEPQYAITLLSTGATGTGYLLKDRVVQLTDFTDAVRRVGRGDLVIDPAVVAQILDRPRSPVDQLSGRERDVLELMAQGRSNQSITDSLVLSPKTVEAHVRSIFHKFGLPPAPDDHRRVRAVLMFLRSADRVL